MPGSGGEKKKTVSPHDSGEDSEDDESEILEESPCGRWQKRRVKVEQRDVPGIDVAYLAMDTEEGREVVWNEVQFSARRDYKAQEEKIKVVFDNLIQLDHPNIVKFYKYWADTKSEKPRVIFITEYMSSGSLKQFLKKVKKDMHYIQEKSWKRWTTQILSALSYLHSCEIPIVHGNLTTDTIFIQHNGLIKIGCVAPDAINNHVKTFREEQKNMHYLAPEYSANQEKVTIGVDIYAFGICALEMAVVDIQGNGDSKKKCISRDAVLQAVEGLKDDYQKDFIRKCLSDQTKRPTARELLLHKVLFEVHSLKLLAAHCIVNTESIAAEFESEVKELTNDQNGERVIASISHSDGRKGVQWKLSQVPALELEKFLEDVENGVYPLTAFALPRPQPTKKNRPQSPETAESVKSETPEPSDVESRHIQEMNCNVKPGQDDLYQLEIHLRMDDKMRRELSCEISKDDKPQDLADELVGFGFINQSDRDQISWMIEERLKSFHGGQFPNSGSAIRAT
ncbi:Nuclear receptor-binding protein [Holothuria leucospilota]|uniref:Nuclear receptor-binding protein homolog n=1 Tax=Holothuria leucospilota TaxID=206669 RepID=A0A9Q1H5D5_HOLLE|nr:Nuclear receptor-binding protein [Holothuria leucospilota]